MYLGIEIRGNFVISSLKGYSGIWLAKVKFFNFRLAVLDTKAFRQCKLRGIKDCTAIMRSSRNLYASFHLPTPSKHRYKKKIINFSGSLGLLDTKSNPTAQHRSIHFWGRYVSLLFTIWHPCHMLVLKFISIIIDQRQS